VGDEFTPLLVTNALSAARRIVETDGEDDESSLQSLAALASLLSTAEHAMVVAGVDRVFDDREPMRRWLTALAASGKNSSDRAKLVSAVAATQIQSAIFDSAVYDGLDIKALGALLSEPHLSELLGRGLSDHLRAPVKQATPATVGKALAAVADFPVLEPLVPVDYLAKRLESNEPSSRLARAVASAIVEEAVREERELAETQCDALREQLTAARAETASARQLAEQAEERAAAADLRWRQALAASAGAHDAQLRQAQIDALRAWVDHIEDDRSVAATIEQPELLERQLNNALRRIQSFAVKVEGQPGQHVAFDPKRHEPLDLDPGTTVEVVTPAYMLADSATPLRYGLVRQIPVAD
jgi:molecular chaperone GrpE (heat shock protein)